MTKNNKYKESPKVKVLAFASKREVNLMYNSIKISSAKSFSIDDWDLKKNLYSVITEGVERGEDEIYKFQDRENITFTIADFNLLIKDLKQPIYTDLEVAKSVSELVERLNNCETLDPLKVEERELEKVV